MGYTHYWRFQKAEVNEEVQEKYQEALKKMRKIIRVALPILAGKNGQGQPNFENDQQEICFNGKGKFSFENFNLPVSLSSLKYNHKEESFDCCKTDRMPYDTVVTACLIVLANEVGSAVRVSSDGGRRHWMRGMALAEQGLKTQFQCPIEETDSDKAEEETNLFEITFKVKEKFYSAG